MIIKGSGVSVRSKIMLAIEKVAEDYERTLTTAYRTPSGCGGDPRRRDAAATRSNEEGVCPDCGGYGEINGQTCQRCGGSGEIGDHGDNEDDIVANETNTEGLGRNRSDSRSVNQIMRDHQTKMSKLYADIDRDLAEQWRRS